MRLVSVERRLGWGSFAALAVGLAALASACETDDGGYIFEEEGASGDGGADSSAGGSKGGSVSGGRGGTNPEGGAGASSNTAGSPEGGGSGGEPTPEGGTAGGVSPPVQAGDGGTATSPGTGGTAGTGGAAPEPTGGGGDPGDTTPPEVTATNPANGSSNVPGSTEIRAQFSEALDAGTVTEDSFVVSVDGVDFPGALDVADDLVTFTPSARFPLLGNVTVTLGAEITDLAGNALAEAPYEWSFQLADGVWHSAGAPLGSGLSPQTAVDASGAVVGWTDSNQLIWAAASDSENGFGTPVSVTASSSPSGFQLGSVGGGAAIAVWIEYPRVRSSKFTPGSGWSSPVFIDQSGAEAASSLELATSENGYAVAAWWSSTDAGASRFIWGNRFSSNSWGTAAIIDSSTTLTYSGDISVSISDSGLAAALGARQDDQVDTVWASTRSGNSWTTPAPLEAVTRQDPMASSQTKSVSQRAIHVGNDGRMLAVWTVYTSGLGSNPPVETRFVRSSTSGTWGTFDSFGDRRGAMWLAGNGDGEVLAAFSYAASAGVVPMRYTPSNGWSALTAFEGTSGVNGGTYADIAIDAQGNGLLVWNPLDTPRAARYVAGDAAAQWSAPPTELGERSSDVSVAVSRKRGAGVAAWADSGEIYARRFDFDD